jgi:DnaK suppressor protein
MLLEKKTRTEASKLQDRKAMLLAKLGDAACSIDVRQDLIVETTADPLDYLQSMNQRDLTIETLNRNSAVARDIKIALQNIESGEYGICMECGEKIPDRRLDAIPWAKHCVVCQEALERGGDGARSDWATAA